MITLILLLATIDIIILITGVFISLTAFSMTLLGAIIKICFAVLVFLIICLLL